MVIWGGYLGSYLGWLSEVVIWGGYLGWLSG